MKEKQLQANQWLSEFLNISNRSSDRKHALVTSRLLSPHSRSFSAIMIRILVSHTVRPHSDDGGKQRGQHKKHIHF